MDHRAGDPARTRTVPDADRVAALLLHAHDALRAATDLVTSAGAAEMGPRPEQFDGPLGKLRAGAEDFAAVAVGSAPYAGERRSVLTALYARADLGRIATLVEQAGDIALARGPRPLTGPVLTPVRELTEACLRLMARAHDVLRSSGPVAVLDRGLAEITSGQRRLGRGLLTGELDCSLRDAVDAAVLGRCHEECASRSAALAGVALR